MTDDAQAWVWQHSRTKNTARLVLLALAHACTDDTATTRMGIAALASLTNATRGAVADGIALVSGLPEVRLDELVRFERGQVGYAVTLDRDLLGCVLLDDTEGLEAGHQVRGSGQVVRVPVGPALLGRTVDPLGRPLDDGAQIEPAGYEPIERPAPGIIDRDFVSEPVQTEVT